MSPERLRSLKEILYAAATHPPDRLDSFLSEVCGGDAELRGEAESLLNYQQWAQTFLETSAIEIQAKLSARGESQLASGTLLNQYRIVSLLGMGAMGEVYLADDTRLPRKVALKILPAGLSSHQDRLRRFEREAYAISALNHPNIITIFEIGESQGVYYLATEYIQGQTLRQLLTEGALPIGQVTEIAIQISGALIAAHNAGVVHRDIKPENIMVRHDGLVKVLDFSLAKLTGDPLRELDSPVSIPGLILGTPNYMSPEQACGRLTDVRTDLFSFGVVIYEMLTGHAPFTGANSIQLITAILTAEPLSLGAFLPQAYPEIQAIIDRALKKEEAERYQTATELLVDLKNFQRWLAARETRDKHSSSQLSSHELGPADVSSSYPTKPVATRSLLYAWGKKIFAPAVEQLVQRTQLRPLSMGLTILILVLLAIGANQFLSQSQIINSVVVIPLENSKRDPDLEPLAEGLTESLINSLSALPALRVISRGAAFRYKGVQIQPQQIGQELNVRALVTGRIIKQGQMLIVSLELVDSRDDRQLWGSRYEITPDTLHQAAPQMSREILTHLGVIIKKADQARLAAWATDSPEAYQLFLYGRYFWNKRSKDNLLKSIEYYLQAVTKDRSFAAAYAGLSAAYTSLGATYFPPREMMPQAKLYALKALDCNPNLPEAHYAMAAVSYTYEWDWVTTRQEIEATLKSNPNEVWALCLYGNLLRTLNRPAEAIEFSKRAVNVDPVSILARANLGTAFYFLRSFEEAEQQYSKAIELEPNYVMAYIGLANTVAQKGKYDEAIATVTRALTISPDNSIALSALGRLYAESGRPDKALQILDKLNQIASKGYVSPTLLAEIYAALGDNNEAMTQLDKAFKEKCARLTSLTDRLSFKNLRSDPRFADLLRQLDIPAVTTTTALK